jgi:hypothetical protein
MTKYSFPLPSAAELVERLESAPPGAPVRRWVLRDNNQQEYHGVVPLRDDPAYVELYWKSGARGRAQLVGLFRLHIAALLSAGYVRREHEGDDHSDDVCLRFHRGDRAVVAVQARDDLPALPIGVVDPTFG